MASADAEVPQLHRPVVGAGDDPIVVELNAGDAVRVTLRVTICKQFAFVSILQKLISYNTLTILIQGDLHPEKLLMECHNSKDFPTDRE